MEEPSFCRQLSKTCHFVGFKKVPVPFSSFPGGATTGEAAEEKAEKGKPMWMLSHDYLFRFMDLEYIKQNKYPNRKQSKHHQELPKYFKI